VKNMIEKINEPKDLKALSIKELEVLAGEIREEIISVVSQTGGHLSSGLGAVELTIALHYVLNAPRDKIIWDVGHQSYAHKIITGRKDRFCTLRQSKGLSGFPKRSESIYDVFDSGHSSTSISAALGIACARDLKKENFEIAAVIGDGSLTCGVAFEGLNQAGWLKRNLIVILNDNEMSISRNVGGLSHYLNRLITLPEYNKLREDVRELIKDIPVVGSRMVEIGEKIEVGLKGIIVPGKLFEEMGFRYFGPIDGHNIQELIDTFKKVREIKGPRLIHVVTKKGKGYKFSEENPSFFHGTSPFNIDTGTVKNPPESVPTFKKVFSDTLVEIAEHDKNIVAITAAMSIGTGLTDFAKKFPDRFFDAGIAEEHAIVFAAGLSLQGFRPVVAIYSTFLQRAYDQILHDICLQNLPVVIVAGNAGIVGEDGPTHHGTFDFSYLRHIPNLTLMAPKDEDELRHMLKTACEYPGPTAIRYPKGRGIGVSLDGPPKEIEIGHAEVLKNGDDAVIIAVGSMVKPGIEAAKILEKEGINAGVINARFVKPLDEKLILSLVKNKHCVEGKHSAAGSIDKVPKFITVEENSLEGGFGSAVMEFLEKENLTGKIMIKRIGLPDRFIEHNSREVLLKEYGLDADGIAGTIMNWLGKK
jgi:1-deoxy-D-xylulose-5-phosphate synthase